MVWRFGLSSPVESEEARSTPTAQDMKTLGLAALPLLALGGSWSAVATEVEMKIDVAGIERTVVITLDEEIAPKTSANFTKLCEEGF